MILCLIIIFWARTDKFVEGLGPLLLLQIVIWLEFGTPYLSIPGYAWRRVRFGLHPLRYFGLAQRWAIITILRAKLAEYSRVVNLQFDIASCRPT